MKKILLIIVLAAMAVADAAAQKVEVESFEADPMDMTAQKCAPADLNGLKCALVKVQVIGTGVEFSGGIIGTPEKHGSEYWVYMPADNKMLKITAESFLPRMIDFPEPLRSGVTYILTLQAPQAAPAAPLAAPGTGTLSINYEPAGAAIIIDGRPAGTTPLSLPGLLPGKYTVAISKDGYTPDTLTATVTVGKTASLSGALTALALYPSADDIALTSEYKKYRNASFHWGFMYNGQVVIPAIYDRCGEFGQGLCAVKRNYKWGYIDKTGTVVIPEQFESAYAFRDGLAIVSKKGKYGFIDRTGKMVIPAKFNYVCPFSEGLAAVEKGKKWGFIDKSGAMVIPAKYKSTGDFREGIAYVRIGDKCGFIDKTATLVIPAKYANAESFSEGLAPVKINDRWGCIDKAGTLVIPAKYDYIGKFSEGLARVYMKEDGILRHGFIDKTGVEVIPLDYQDSKCFSEGLAAVKTKVGWGYVDKTGKMVIPERYWQADSFSDGKARVSLPEHIVTGGWYYIDRQGNRVN